MLNFGESKVGLRHVNDEYVNDQSFDTNKNDNLNEPESLDSFDSGNSVSKHSAYTANIEYERYIPPEKQNLLEILKL